MVKLVKFIINIPSLKIYSITVNLIFKIIIIRTNLCSWINIIIIYKYIINYIKFINIKLLTIKYFLTYLTILIHSRTTSPCKFNKLASNYVFNCLCILCFCHWFSTYVVMYVVYTVIFINFKPFFTKIFQQVSLLIRLILRINRYDIIIIPLTNNIIILLTWFTIVLNFTIYVILIYYCYIFNYSKISNLTLAKVIDLINRYKCYRICNIM